MNKLVPPSSASSAPLPRRRARWIALLAVLLAAESAAVFLLTTGWYLKTGLGLPFWTALALIWIPAALLILGVKWLFSRRPFQFSLRALLTSMVLLAAALGWVGILLQQTRRQRATAAALERRGARITWAGADEPGLKQLLGIEYFSAVVDISFNKPGSAGDVQLAQLHVFKDTLESLHIVGGPVTGDGLASLEKLTNLRRLSCTQTPLGDDDLLHLGRLPRLEKLELYSARLNGRGLAHLARLENLEDLNLNGSPITDAGLAHIGGLRNLRSLRLDRTAITDAGLAHLEALPNLRVLELGHTTITDAGMVHVGRLHNLKRLGLRFTPVSDVGLMHLKTLDKLRMLVIDQRYSSRTGRHPLQSFIPQLVVGH